MEDVGQRDAKRQRHRCQDLEIDHRLDADPTDFLQIAGAGDAVDHDTEDDRRDQHLDQLDETVAKRFQLRGEFGRNHA